MKKKLFVFMLIAVLCLAFYGCGDKSSESYENDIDAEQLAGYISDNVTFRDEMSELEDDIMYNIYGISKEDADNMCVYMSSGATAEEIAVVTVESKEQAETVKDAFNKRIEYQKAGFENYVPEEMPLLENALVIEENGVMVLLVCDDKDEGKTAVQDYLEENL